MGTTWLPKVVIQDQLGGGRHRPGQWGRGVLRKMAMGRGREGLHIEWQPSLNLELESRATEQKPNSGLGQGGWDR